MIRYQNQKQRCLEGSDTPSDMILDPKNRWVKLSDRIPWDELADSYYKTLLPHNIRTPIQGCANSDRSSHY